MYHLRREAALSILFMKNLPLSPLVWTLITLVWACNPKGGEKISRTPATPTEPAVAVEPKPLIGEEAPEEQVLEYPMDPIEITPEATYSDSLIPYNAAHTFEHDIEHIKIEISFDWEKKRAKGRTTLTMHPWFYATDKATLDAKNFDIHSVTFDGSSTPLKYDYNNEQLVVYLGKQYTRSESFKLKIDYTAKPDERKSYGGSAAITQDKGLYFINADGKDPNKPRQIWTQGETESNSFWFPTTDKPNERCTQEMYITVADNFKTLSNGLLIRSTKNTDGTRTDYWKMDKPHAPYLFMMAIGEFAVVKDKWRNLEVDYYVEPKYEAYARDIFPYTPQMLEFFSNKLGYDYPWQKYAQVIVRDYVSGAMENTSAVIFGEFMQKSSRELLDNNLTNEKIVAHEMFHHWFGDLVTTESWANLTLNEGFANYSEYLWLEHYHGAEIADEHLEKEQDGYFNSATDGGHPLIHYGYDSREDMFDAHSYNKGGCVLHMLRKYVGDEAFFASLQRYLRDNEYTQVEVDELRMAFEDVTGMDLQWFFNQWYIGAGHPAITIDYAWDEAAKHTKVTIEQTQTPSAEVANVFRLPLQVDVYEANGSKRREMIDVTKRKQDFFIKSASKPAFVNVDADKALLAIKTDNHSPEEWEAFYSIGPLYRDRIEALIGINQAKSEHSKLINTAALKDKSPEIRLAVLSLVEPTQKEALPTVAAIAENDKNPRVRAKALTVLAETADKAYLPVFQKTLEDKKAAYSVIGAALNGMVKLDSEAATKAAQPLENEEAEGIVLALCELFANQPNMERVDWFNRKAEKMDFMGAFTFFEQYQKFVVGLKDNAVLNNAVMSWKANALTPDKNSEWRRFASTKAIADTRNFLNESGQKDQAGELEKIIAEIKEKETDPTLKLYYGLF
jgi:aminopeptidase N